MRRRTLWIIGGLATIILLAWAGPQLVWGYSFWRANKQAEAEMGPYVQEIRDEVRASRVTGKWGERVSIETELIAENLERTVTETNLHDSKFEQLSETFRKPEPPVSESVEIYQRTLGGLPCNTTLQLYLVFDDQDQLVDASGAIFEAGCL